MIIAIDFDGTLVNNNPITYNIVSPRLETIEMVKKLKAQGHTIILWTCRITHRLDEAIEYCKQYGLEFDYHNENCPVAANHEFGDGRKIYAHLYLDNAAITAVKNDKEAVEMFTKALRCQLGIELE